MSRHQTLEDLRREIATIEGELQRQAREMPPDFSADEELQILAEDGRRQVPNKRYIRDMINGHRAVGQRFRLFRQLFILNRRLGRAISLETQFPTCRRLDDRQIQLGF